MVGTQLLPFHQLEQLRRLLLPVLDDPEALEKYSHDFTEDLKFPPQVVVLPSTTQQVSEILKFARCY